MKLSQLIINQNALKKDLIAVIEKATNNIYDYENMLVSEGRKELAERILREYFDN